ncbi:MAG: hypothetical protein ACOC83_06020, partial [Gemmatimonadota bacterium]
MNGGKVYDPPPIYRALGVEPCCAALCTMYLPTGTIAFSREARPVHESMPFAENDRRGTALFVTPPPSRSDSCSTMPSFLAELKRRRVVRVALVYGAVA